MLPSMDLTVQNANVASVNAFTYLFVIGPQYEHMIKKAYEHIYGSLSNTKNPHEMLDAAKHLTCCITHFNNIKEHLLLVLKSLDNTELGDEINKGKEELTKFIQKIQSINNI